MTYSEMDQRRILVVDDNLSIQEDYRKILVDELQTTDVDNIEAELFGAAGDASQSPEPAVKFRVDFAQQGQEGLERVEQSARDADPYALAFVDVRMPPGWDGVETVGRMWKVDPRLQVVLCTAYSDHTWQDIITRLGKTDRLLILKKPFDGIEIRQMALTLTTKWIMTQNAEATIQGLLNQLMQAADNAAA